MQKRRHIGRASGKNQRIVQVPMSPQLIAAVDRLAQVREESRAAFVRRACEHLLDELHERELEAAYERGYLEQPEELEFAETTAQLAAETWPNEDWSDAAVSKRNPREDR